MNKELTIYELLGLIKDDKAPKKIKYEYLVYELTFERNDYYCKQEMRWFTSEINSLGVLNNKVEIIEEDKDIEELKIENDNPTHFYIRDEKGTKCGMTKHSKMIAEKLNEVIREVNKLRSKEQ